MGLFEKWFRKPLKRDQSRQGFSLKNVPLHIAIIMDGNGRWAKQRGLPRIAGHQNGMETVQRIVQASGQMGIKVLTLFAFSTENWKRPKDEVEYLMKLPEQYMATELQKMIDNNVQVRMLGYWELLPEATVKILQEAIAKTAHNTGLIVNFALNYGSRQEIVGAAKKLAHQALAGKLDPNEIKESDFQHLLLSSDLPDPDLVIRTGGELRISNFMLWQLAYSEFWFSEVYWPEFTENHLRSAIIDYQRRIRRFGGV